MAAAHLLAAAWALLPVLLAWAHRPPPLRLRRLAFVARSTSPQGRPRPGKARGHGLERLGGVVLRVGGRLRRAGGASTRPAPSALTTRRTGLALIAALAVLPVVAPAAVPAALMGWALPGVAVKRAERRRLAAIRADVPEVVDLLVLAVGAGLTVHLAIEKVAARATGPLAVELGWVMAQVRLGRRLSDALDDLPARAGEAVRPLVGALVSSERYGAPLAAGLDRLADDVRRDRRRRAEEAARKVPVKLLFPLVTCTLPAFGLLTVAPLVASAVRSLRI